MSGKSVLVLGASGHLGQHICAAFAAAGARVIRLSRGDGRTGVRNFTTGTVHLDLTATGSGDITRLCADAGAQIVVNAVGAVWQGTEAHLTELNARLVGRLVEAVADVPQRPRFIQLGSAYEYGSAGPDDLIGEDWPAAPEAAYGRTKLAGTLAVVRAAQDRSIDGVTLRVAVVCGPGVPRASLPGTVAASLAAGHDVLRLAPLRAHRDFVDVRDVADAVVAAAGVPAGAFAGSAAVFNIASGESVAVRDLVNLMIACSGRRVRVQEGQPAQSNRSDALWQRLDISKARLLLGWAPRRPLTESVCDLLTAAGVPVPTVAKDSPFEAANGQRKERP